MKKILIVGGHRQGDPGANYGKWSEVTLYDQLYPSLVKYAKLLKNAKVDFYDLRLNMYYETQKGRGAHSVKGKYDYVMEVHWDAGVVGVSTGGHVIVGGTPDATDKRIANVIGNYIGWSRKDGFSIRRDLLQLNVFYPTKTSYSLIEMGFVTNTKDINAFLNNKDAIGKKLIEAVSGETLSTSAPKPNTPSKSAPSKSFKVGDKVKIVDALYKDSAGAGRSIASRGKTGTIKRIVAGNKPYLIDKLGWAHDNDIELAKDTTYPAKKIGDTVTVQSFAARYQTGQVIAPFVKGKKYKIKQVKNVNQSKSKRAYLLEGINSWVLEQDVK